MNTTKPSMIRFAQPFKKKVKRRPCGLPREWAPNGYDYIGDSWSIHGNRLINIKGKKFWSLLVLSRDRTRSSRAYSYWLCECDCGRRYSIRSDRLRNGLIVCCPICTEKVNLLYKHMRDEKRTVEQLARASERREQLKIIRASSLTEAEIEANNTIHIVKVMTEQQKIIQMRDIIGMKISEIAFETGMSQDSIRMILIESRNLTNKEKDQVMTSTVMPSIEEQSKDYNDFVAEYAPVAEAAKKRRFTISDTGNTGGMTPKQLREYMNGAKVN